MSEYSHTHGHAGGCDCGCGCGSDCKCGCNSHGHHHHDGECKCVEKFLEIADDAWREVLKEKIKAKIIDKKNDHMEKLAEMIAMANGSKWKHKISAKANDEEFKENLKKFFSEHD